MSRMTVLRRAARAGADRASEAFRTPLTVETKAGPLDSVTEVDRAAQRHVTEVIRQSYPEEPVVGEEGDARKSVPESGPAWIVDPIDGTNNYVAGSRVWATSVATVRDGDPVGAVNRLPAVGDTYAAGDEGATRNADSVSVSSRADPATFTVSPIFGVTDGRRAAMVDLVRAAMDVCGDTRRYGSAQAVLSMVASGELDAAVSPHQLPPWDTVAGVHLVRAAGGVVTDLDGERWHRDADGLVASNGNAHGRLVEAFRRAGR